MYTEWNAKSQAFNRGWETIVTKLHEFSEKCGADVSVSTRIRKTGRQFLYKSVEDREDPDWPPSKDVMVRQITPV